MTLRTSIVVALLSLAFGLACSAEEPFRLDLTMVARSVTGTPGSETLTDLPTGPISAVVGTRYRVEVRYRIADLVSDSVGSTGLVSTQIELRPSGVGQYANLRRSPLSNAQTDSANSGNPDTSGLTLAEDQLTGLVGPFRSGLTADNSTGNGGNSSPPYIVSLSSPFYCIPLSLTPPAHKSWTGGSAPTSQNTNTNPAVWSIYAFEFVYQGGSLTWTASALPDPTTGTRFGCYLSNSGSVPQTFSAATDGSITFVGPDVATNFRLELEWALRDVSPQGVLTDVPISGPVPGVIYKNYRLELRYRIRDLDPSDNITSTGLCFAAIRVDQGSANGWFDRAPLTWYQLDPLSFAQADPPYPIHLPPLNPDDTGQSEPQPTTGLTGLFRLFPEDYSAANGGAFLFPWGFRITPFRLASPGHRSSDTDFSWTIYSLNYRIHTEGTYVLRAEAISDPDSYTSFATFTNTGLAPNALPLLGAPTIGASITITTFGACCAPNGICSLTSVRSCVSPAIHGGAATACSPNPCTSTAMGRCCVGSRCATAQDSQACTALADGAAGAVFTLGQVTCNAHGVVATPCCFADYNKTGGVSVQDVFDFLGGWFAGSPNAAVGGDGSAPTVQSIFDFLATWFLGGC